ncbi:hypothetical protein BASA62_010157 [Batrachochytrium salamandrivorans]|nr:hypothetical protein BASA62_010157 [Batrachochytrium salamandrivorans]
MASTDPSMGKESLWSVSPDDKHAIMHIRDQYVSRVNTLTASLSTDITSAYLHPPPRQLLPKSPPSVHHHSRTAASFELSFLNIMRHDMSRHPLPSPLSSNPLLRPIQIMQRLAMSMTHGEFLTLQLYIPADVWVQPGGKVSFLDLKYHSFNQLWAPLDRLRSAQQNDPDMIDMPSFNKAVEEFEVAIDAIRALLSKKLKYLTPEEDSRASSSFLDTPVSHDSVTSLSNPPSTGRDRLLSWSNKFQKSLEKFKSVKEKSSNAPVRSATTTSATTHTSSNSVISIPPLSPLPPTIPLLPSNTHPIGGGPQ